MHFPSKVFHLVFLSKSVFFDKYHSFFRSRYFPLQVLAFLPSETLTSWWCSPNRGKVLICHTVLGVNAFLYILLMNRKHRRNTQPCCTTSFGGERIYIHRKLQEGSSAVVRCFCSLNWHLSRSTPVDCWVT